MGWKILFFLCVTCHETLSGPIFLSKEETENQTTHYFVRQPSTIRKICLTAGCIKAASDLLSTMDQTADPCSDFYQFACGRFNAETVMPDHQAEVGSISIIREEINKRLRKLFEAGSSKTEPRVFGHIRNYYNSCMNKEAIKRSNEYLKEILEKIGGWPVLEGENWRERNFQWYELTIKAAQEGFFFVQMISIGIEPDTKDSSKRILRIKEPSLGLSQEFLQKGFDDEVVQAYYNFMVKTAVFFGAEEISAQREMKQALRVELKLAEISLKQEEKRNITALDNRMTLGKAQKLYPEFPLVKYTNFILGFTDFQIDEIEIVSVAAPKYVTEFRKYISTVPTRTQANYIVWRVIMYAMEYLGDDALQIKLNFEKAMINENFDKILVMTTSLYSVSMTGLDLDIQNIFFCLNPRTCFHIKSNLTLTNS